MLIPEESPPVQKYISITITTATANTQVKRYEITEVRPDKTITLAMDKQAAAERNRREIVIKAEGEKRAQELKSGQCCGLESCCADEGEGFTLLMNTHSPTHTATEGVKLKLLRESEGDLIKTKNEAEARKQQYILEGEGEAQAIRLKAQVRACVRSLFLL